MKIGVVDYKAGNLKSVETALSFIGAEFFITDKPEQLKLADKLIFPGVGAASSAMDNLTESGLGDAIKEFAGTGKEILGICLGSQIILDSSEEGNVPCLGLIPGKAQLFQLPREYKVPHMGWNQIEEASVPWEKIDLFKGVKQASCFYFVHSYYPQPLDPKHSLALSYYGNPFSAALRKDNITAFQFHPEKSGPDGLQILKNYTLKEAN